MVEQASGFAASGVSPTVQLESNLIEGLGQGGSNKGSAKEAHRKKQEIKKNKKKKKKKKEKKT